MNLRILRTCALAAMAAACVSPPPARRLVRLDSLRALADSGPLVTTVGMRQDLTSDLRSAERDLRGFEDSISVFMGPDYAATMLAARTQWNAYRRAQCSALRAVFAPGTMGPVSELECFVELTDQRREFLQEQYNFVRPARRSLRPGRP
jgi:hypothetical protein